MNRMMITAHNTMKQLQYQLDVISSNIANVETTGYKRKTAPFSDLLFQQINNQADPSREVGRRTPHGIRQGIGAKIAQVQSDETQGTIVQTDRKLDFAFTREHQYLKVLVQQDGEAEVHYTRDGSFYLSPIGDNEMALVTADGHFVLDENDQPIVYNGEITNISLLPGGTLRLTGANGAFDVNLGVVHVTKPQFLMQAGKNLLRFPDNLAELNVTEDAVLTNLTGTERNQIALKQGALERSNVDLTEEFTNLIQTQRTYQFQARAISLADQMFGLVNGIR